MKFKKACKIQIKEILEDFDHEKAEKIMSTLGWNWVHNPCFLDSIKITAERLLNDVRKQLKNLMKIRKEDEQYIATSISTGGVTVDGEVSFASDDGHPFVRFRLYFGLSYVNDGTSFEDKYGK